MTNKEKAYDLYLNIEQANYEDERLANAFVRGADWKDQQFKEYLEKRRNRIVEIDTKDYKGWEIHYMADITEIINELFKE